MMGLWGRHRTSDRPEWLSLSPLPILASLALRSRLSWRSSARLSYKGQPPINDSGAVAECEGRHAQQQPGTVDGRIVDLPAEKTCSGERLTPKVLAAPGLGDFHHSN